MRSKWLSELCFIWGYGWAECVGFGAFCGFRIQGSRLEVRLNRRMLWCLCRDKNSMRTRLNDIGLWVTKVLCCDSSFSWIRPIFKISSTSSSASYPKRSSNSLRRDSSLNSLRGDGVSFVAVGLAPLRQC